MGMNSPAEIAKNYVAIGKAKANLAIDKMFVDYYGAAEPPVRCGVSHLSELTEPLLEIAI